MNHLQFASDLVILCRDTSKFTEMLEQVIAESAIVGISVNLQKWKLLTAGDVKNYKICSYKNVTENNGDSRLQHKPG